MLFVMWWMFYLSRFDYVLACFERRSQHSIYYATLLRRCKGVVVVVACHLLHCWITTWCFRTTKNFSCLKTSHGVFIIFVLFPLIRCILLAMTFWFKLRILGNGNFKFI